MTDCGVITELQTLFLTACAKVTDQSVSVVGLGVSILGLF